VATLFKPFGVIGGLIAGLLGRRLFDWIWGKIDQQEPPEAKHSDVGLGRLVLSLVLQGAIFSVVRGLFDHHSRRAFQRFTGRWPGEQAPEFRE